MFRQFFKPKWQHKDISVRKQALLALNSSAEESQSIFWTLAREDTAPEIRRLAIKRLRDLGQIHSCIEQENHEETRKTAIQRFRTLLAGDESTQINFNTRKSYIDSSGDLDLHEFLIRHAKEPELRLAAMAHIERDALLGDVAINDNDRDVRLQAIDRVTQTSTLERVYKTLRTKDKRVSKRAKEKLDVLKHEAQKRQATISAREKICLIMEALHKKQSWERLNSEFIAQVDAWNKLPPQENNDALQQRYDNAYTTFQNALEAQRQTEAHYTPIRQKKNQLLLELDKLLDSVNDGAQTGESDIKNSRQQVETIEDSWSKLAPLPENEAKEFNLELREKIETLDSRLNHAEQFSKQSKLLSAIIEEAKKLESTNNLESRQLNPLETQFNTHTWLKEIPQYQEAAELLTSLKNKVKQKKDEVGALRAAIEAELPNLEEHLDQGELKPALQSEQKITQCKNKLKKLGQEQLKPQLSKRLNNALNRLRDLKSWYQWSSAPHQETLCQEMEELVGADMDPAEIARLVKEARDKWKKLGLSNDKNTRAMWDRFNKACNEAYAPCIPYFEEQAKQRQENYLARENLCQELETFINNTDWQNADWKLVDKILRKSLETWRGLGPTDHKHRKKLQKRFNDYIKTLKSNLHQEWANNYPKKKALIDKVAALKDHENLQEAIRTIKHAQQEWKDAGRVSQKQEHLLWKQFRAACDAVFDKRKEKAQADENEYQARLAHKSSYIEQINELASSGNNAQELQHNLADLQKAYQHAPNAGREGDKSLERKLKEAVNNCRKRIESLHSQQALDGIDSAISCAKVCAQLMTALQSNAEADAPRFEAACGSLDDATLLPLLKQQHQQLTQLAETRQTDAINAYFADQQQDTALQRITIEMEVFADVDSPNEDRELRMAMQVERLSEEMTALKTETPDPQTETAHWRALCGRWFAVSGASAQHYTNMLARLENAHKHFKKKTLGPV